MKKITPLLSLCLLFFSCGKSENPQKDKTIERALICFEKAMISKSDSIYIGVRYFKNYTDADEISLKINGITGKKIGPRVTEFEGTNYLFAFAPLNSNGNFSCDLVIDNSQKKFTQNKTIKIIDNYLLETVWDQLNYNYLSNCFPLMSSAKSINFSPLINNNLGQTLNIGIYFNKPVEYNPFIIGINGKYSVIFDGSNNLQQIPILNGDYADSNFKYQDVINDLTNAFGQSKSTTIDNFGGKVTRFVTNRLKLLAYEKFNGTFTTQTIISVK